MWQDFALHIYDPANINGHWQFRNEWHCLEKIKKNKYLDCGFLGSCHVVLRVVTTILD
jgi:hypothetical protein